MQSKFRELAELSGALDATRQVWHVCHAEPRGLTAHTCDAGAGSGPDEARRDAGAPAGAGMQGVPHQPPHPPIMLGAGMQHAGP